MNWDVLAGQCRELMGKLMEEWGLLVANDALAVEGKREQQIGRLQFIHGARRAQIESHVSAWLARR